MKTLLLILAFMFCVANMAHAQPGGPGGPGGPPPFAMPGVSPEKCQAVDKIFKDAEARMFPLRQEIEVLKARLEALVVDAASDDAAIAALVEDMGKARTAMAKVMIEARRKALKETGVIVPRRGPGGPGGHGPMGPPGFPG
jgi:Spy/CpxP family protein refolding chaperone